MRLITLFFFLSICILNFAQGTISIPSNGCPENTSSTNPLNYSNNADPNNEKLWNWMSEDFIVYYPQNGQGTPGVAEILKSPFYELITNPNTVHFVDQIQKDFYPENGWELLARNFGSESQGLDNPFFILYNRFSGTIRVFVNIRNSGNSGYDAALITLSFDNNKRKSALFNQLGELTNAVNNFNKRADSKTVNQYVNSGVNDNYFWLWGDFTSLYDPCTCGIEADIDLKVRLISQVAINLKAGGQLTTIVDNTSSNSTFENSSFHTVKQYVSAAIGVATDPQGSSSSANKAYDKGAKLQSDANKFDQNFSDLFGQSNVSPFADITYSILSGFPKVNKWLKYSSTIIAIIKKSNSDISSLSNDEKLDLLKNTTLSTQNLKLTVSGNLETSNLFVTEKIALPGSIQTNINSDFRKPVYNNSLGVINLLEQPVVKITRYNPPSPLFYQVGQSPAYFEDNSQIDVFPPIIHVEVLDELKVVFNPSSGLKIKSIESRLEFLNREPLQNKLKGPMSPGVLKTFTDFGFLESSITDRELHYLEQGYTLEMFNELYIENNKWDKSLFSTPYLPQGCFKNTSLYSFSGIEDLRVKIKVVLEPEIFNPDSEVDDIIFVYSYPVIVKNVNSSVPYVIDGVINDNVSAQTSSPLGITIPGITYSPLMNMPYNAIFKNKLIDQDYFVNGDLTIDENVSYSIGNFTLKATGNIFINKTPLQNDVTIPVNYSNYNITYVAGKEIIVSPDVTIYPETKLEIDPTIKLNCGSNVPILVDQTEINTYCSSQDYNNRSASKSYLDNYEQNFFEVEPKQPFSFSLFPNPTTQQTTVKVNGEYADQVSIVVYDIAGKEQRVAISGEGGRFNLDVAHLAKGLYLVKVSTFGESQTKQLVIN